MPKQPTRDAGFAEYAAPNFRSGKSWFFGIGINHYQHFSDLNNAVKDVKDLIILLQEKYDLGPDHVITLFDEEANRRNIIRTFDRLQKEVRPDDKLLIYYSGHGHLVDTGQSKKGFWIPTDAEKDNTAQYIRNSTVREYVEDINSLHTLLISDACFSGSLFVRGSSRAEIALNELEQIKSRWAICSGRHDEKVYDGDPGTNSPFADSILDTLRSNQRPKLNVAKLADRVVELTRANYEQLPEGNPLFGVGHKGGQYVFSMKANEAADWQYCQSAGRPEDYQAFLAKYPEGLYTDAAKSRLKELQEEAAWEKAEAEGTILSYYDYSRNYPTGRYLSDALAKMKQLEEETAWQKAQHGNTLSAFVEYKNQYPQGRFFKEAEERIQVILNKQQAVGVKSVHHPQEANYYRHQNKKKKGELPKTVQSTRPSVTGLGKKYVLTDATAITVIAIGWAIGAAIGYVETDLASAIGGVISTWPFAGPITGGTAGAMGGIFTGWIMKWKYTELGWNEVLLITTGWTIGLAIAWGSFVGMTTEFGLAGGLAGVAMGGLFTGWVMKLKYAKLGWDNVLFISTGWTIGWIFGLAVIFVTSIVIAEAIAFSISGAIGGAIGGSVMFRQLRNIPQTFREKRK